LPLAIVTIKAGSRGVPKRNANAAVIVHRPVISPLWRLRPVNGPLVHRRPNRERVPPQRGHSITGPLVAHFIYATLDCGLTVLLILNL